MTRHSKRNAKDIKKSDDSWDLEDKIVVGTYIGFFLLLIVVSFFGIPERPPNPRMDLVGLWEGASVYLFVENDFDKTIHTNIEVLNNPFWKYDSSKRNIFISEYRESPIVAILHVSFNQSNSYDLIEVTGSRGVMAILIRRKVLSHDLINDLSNYSQGLFSRGIAYPDGIVRLTVLYIIVLFSSIFFWTTQSTFPIKINRLLGTILFSAIGVISSIVFGYLLGLFKWIAMGYWDPVISGRAMIWGACAILVLISLYTLFNLFQAKRRVQHDSAQGNRRAWLRILLIVILFISDLFGVVSFTLVIFRWLQ